MIFEFTDEENLAICLLQEENENFLLEEQDLAFIEPEQGNCTSPEDTLCILEDEFGGTLFIEQPLDPIFVEFCSSFTITKLFRNSQQECIDRTFRVVGKCRTPPPACNLPACPSQFIANIFACNVEQVLNKIQTKNFNSPINKIQVFDKNNCLSDVDLTQIISDCDNSNICDLFLDEHALEDVDVVTTVTTHDEYTPRIRIALSGGATSSYSVNGGNYTFVGRGAISLSSNSLSANSYWNYVGSGSVSLTSKTASRHSANYSYVGSGFVSVNSNTQLGFNHVSSGSINIRSGTIYSLNFSKVMSGVITLGSRSTFVSPNYVYTGSGGIALHSDTLYFNNNYGVIDFDFIYDDEIALDVANFAFDEADSIFSPVVENLNICDVDISEILQVRHNLNLLPSLNYFLIRNGLRFDSVFQMQYSRRLNAWTANFHFKTNWSLLFELSCDGDDWSFAMTINYSDVYDAMVRFLIVFDKSDFVQDDLFSDFIFDFNFIKNDLAKYSVFHDKNSLFANFPDNLRFEIFENVARDEFLDTQSQEEAQRSVREPVGV